MEIDITSFVRSADPASFSASRAELGADAGPITWSNAKQEAASTALLGENDLAAFRDWIEGFGAWNREEIDAWSAIECNALLIQYISGDLRELESLCYSEADEFGVDWTKAEELANEGAIGGHIYKGDDGAIYVYLGG